MSVHVDPVTFEVIRHSVVAIMDEIEADMERTAFSPLIFEYKDYGVGLLDAQGRIIAQSRGSIPTFLADMGSPIRDALELWDGVIEDGDIVLTNYPGVSGQHLNNVDVFTPIFHEGRLTAFVATRAHWADVGGQVTGSSTSTNTTEIYQEGIQFRCLKVYKRGEADAEILRVVSHNTRFPTMVLGDLNAQIAACLLGKKQFLALVKRYSWPTVEECVHLLWDATEKLARQSIARIPDGVYTAESFLDDDGVQRGQHILVKVKVIISGEQFTVDFSEVGNQVKGPFNSGPTGGGMTAAKVAFKCVTLPDVPANEGAFRPLQMILPPGKFISAAYGAAMARWPVPMPTVIDTILRALSPAMPDQIPAGHHSAQGGFVLSGFHNGQRWTHHDTAHGGWGGTSSRDGFGPLKTMAHGDCKNVPAEVGEAVSPVVVECNSIRPDSGGPGKFRGAPGLIQIISPLVDCIFSCTFERTECPPWGLQGGKPSQVGQVVVEDPDGGNRRTFTKVTAHPVKAGSRVTLYSAGGGGYGHPWERELEAVRKDVERGIVTPEAAGRDYGVAIDGTTLVIDRDATARLRSAMQVEG